MRIAYLIGTPLPSPKASAVQVMQMCQALARLGHAVTLFAPQSPFAKDQSPAIPPNSAGVFAHYGVEPIFQLRSLPRGDGRAGAALFQVRAALAGRAWGGGVCYARGRNYLAPLLALRLGGRAIFEAHGLPASAREAAALRRLARSRNARVVVISYALRGEILAQANDQGRTTDLVVAPDGVDLRAFTPPLGRDEARRACGLPVDRPLIVYVGGLYAGRGLEELIAAVGALAAVPGGAPPQLVVVGGRAEAEIRPFRRMASECGTEAVFAGYRPPAEIPRWLFAADVLAMPYAQSLETASGEDTARWMSPLKMFEYMASGRPIVATDLPALREVLRPRENALLAQPGRADSLREQIACLLQDPALAGRLGAQARLDAQGYTWESRAERILRGWS